MSDRLYQVFAIERDEINPDSLEREIVAIIRALEAGADSRPLPVALDWSDFRINLEPGSGLTSGLVKITASAPVL